MITIDQLKQNLGPAKLAALLAAGVTIGQFYSLTEFWYNALSFGGQVLGTAALLLIIDAVVDAIVHRQQLIKDRTFRLKWMKAKQADFFAKTKRMMIFSLAVSFASLFVPMLPALLMTAVACAVFTFSTENLAHALKKMGYTKENNNVLRGLHIAASVMTPILSYLQTRLNQLKTAVMSGLESAFTWTAGVVMKTTNAVFTNVQQFVSHLLRVAAKRSFSNDTDEQDPGVYQAVPAN